MSARRLRLRSTALLTALVTLSSIALQALPAPARAADPGVADLKQMVTDVGTWTGALADTGKLAEQVPLVGRSAGSILGFPDLVQKAVSDQISSIDAFDSFSGDHTFSLADGRTGTLTLSNTTSGDTHTVDFSLDLLQTLDNEPFRFSTDDPKVDLSSAGGVHVSAHLHLDFRVVVEPRDGGGYTTSLVRDLAANTPGFTVDVSVELPDSSPGLSAAVGILGVTATADPGHRSASMHLVGTVDDPDGDGRLYVTRPDGSGGELSDLSAAAGLWHVEYATAPDGAGSVDVALNLAARSSLLPDLNAGVSISWPDISTGSPSVDASGLDPVTPFQRLSSHDLADMLGQLVSLVNGAERSPANKPLPFLSGTVADAVKGAEALTDFLKRNVVQSDPTATDPLDPARVGEPSFRSIQDLVGLLAGYATTDAGASGHLDDATLALTVGDYDATNDRLPLDLTITRTATAPVDLVQNTIAVSGTATGYGASSLEDTGTTFDASLVGRHVIAGSSGGTIQSISADGHTLTLGAPWVGGTPASGTAYSVSGPEADAGTVNLADLLAAGGKKIANANAIQPTARVTPTYSTRLRFALDLSAPKTGTDCAGAPTGDPSDPTATACPFTRTNPDGTKTVVTELPLPVERLLIGTGYDLLTADFPIDAGADIYAKAGFLKVKVNADVKVCAPDAGADCTGTSSQHMLGIQLNAITGDPADGYVPVADFFTSLIGATAADRLGVTTHVRGYASGSISVPDAADFLPGGATAGFTATFGDITNSTTLSVDATDLSEILDFDVDPSDPNALLGVILQVLQKLDDQLQSGGGSGVLTQKLPLVDTSLRDLLGATEAGGGTSVSYDTGTFDPDGAGGADPVATTTLTDSSRTGDREFGSGLIGRSVVVGTQVGVVLDVQNAGTTLQLTQLSVQPADGTAYTLRSEIADVVSLLTASPPDSVQDLVHVLNNRLGHTLPITFGYGQVGTDPQLKINLDWDRSFSRSTPLSFDLGGQTLAGTAGKGTADITVASTLNLGLAVPLGTPPSDPTAVPLQVLDNSQLSIDAHADVTGTAQATLGPLAISLGDPTADPSGASAHAHYQVGIAQSGGSADSASTLTDFLDSASLTANDYTGGVDCGVGSGDDLALCANLPFYVSSDDGTTWSQLEGASSNPLALVLRLPKSGSDLFGLTGTVSSGDTRLRLESPSTADLEAAFSAALLNFGTIGDGLDAFLRVVENALNAATLQGKLPVIGNDLQAGADFVGKLRTNLDALFAQVKGVNGGKLPDVATINDYLDTRFQQALSDAGADPQGFQLTVECTLQPADVTDVTPTLPEGETPTATYTYGVVAVGTDGSTDVDTVVGATKSTDNVATLDTTHYNTVTWAGVSNATKYKLLRQTPSGWTLIATVTADGSTSYSHDDKGGAGTAYTPPTEPPTVDDCTGVTIYDVTGVVLRVDIGTGTVDASQGCSADCASQSIPIDVGVPGLAIRPAGDGGGGGLTAKLGWRMHLAFSLDKTDGFSLLTKDQGLPEIGVGVQVDLDSALQAELAFLKVDVSKHGTAPAFVGAFQVDLKSGAGETSCWSAPCTSDPTMKLGLAQLQNAKTYSDVIAAQLDLNLNVDWLLKATADAELPGIQARLVMTWAQTVSTATLTSTQLGELHIGFEDVALDAGDFLDSVLGPIVRQIKSVTGPLQPVIDTLYQPIPVLSDLSEAAGGPPVTLVTLAKTFSTLTNGPDLSFVDTVANVITFVNNLPTPKDGVDLLVPIGGFDLSSTQAWNVQITPDTGRKVIKAGSQTYKKKESNGTYTDTTDKSQSKPKEDIDSKSTKPALTNAGSGGGAVATGAGFAFPFLDDPAQIFNLIMGGDVDLVTFDSGDLGLAFTWRQAFGPVYAPPPVFITLSGSASVTAHITAGFDTYGLRKAFESGVDTGAAYKILDGLYFRSTDDNGAPLPVITLYGEIAAGAAVSAVVITVGVEGGVSLTIHFAWNDPNGDGKFRLFEFGRVAMNNPICLFQASGRLGLFLRVYITIGVSPFDVSFDFTLADITLLDFSVKPNCDPPPPHLGGVTADGKTLVVFAGKLGGGDNRGNEAWDNTGADYGGDFVKVTELHDFTKAGAPKSGVKIDMLGITESWADPDIERVVVDGRGYAHQMKVTLLGDGDKSKTSKDPEVVPTGDFDLDAVILGGTQADTVKTGFGRSIVDGGGGNDTITLSDAPGAGTTWVAGGPGDDSVTTGNADAVAAGDSAIGVTGADLTQDLTLADGSTRTVGGIVNWGSGSLHPPNDGESPSTDGNDRVTVGRGTNSVYGNGGNDAVGVAADSPVPGGPTDGKNMIVLGTGSDTAKGGSNDDTIWTGKHTSQTRAAADVDGDGGEDSGTLNVVDTGTGNDTVFGGTIPDYVTTGSTTSQQAVVVGGKGNDVLLGSYGTDHLFGGPDQDWVVAEPAQVGPETGTDAFGSVRTYQKTPLPVGVAPSTKLLVGGDGADRIIGGDGDSTIFGDRYETVACGPVGTPESTQPAEPTAGSPGRDLITGGAGVDTVKAGGAADRVHTYGGDDLICGQGGNDELYAGDGADTIWGGSGVDHAYGENGPDHVYGNDDGDYLYGGDQNDVLEGNGGLDHVDGGTGDDLVLGGTRAAGAADVGDVLYGGSGQDTVIGDNGSDTYPYDLASTDTSVGGGDVIFAGADNDHAYGGVGGDTVILGGGDDYAEGNPGVDTIFGNAGADDIIGGSSQVPHASSPTVGYPDEGDFLYGGGDDDVITGDNAVIADTTAVSDGDPVMQGREMSRGRLVTLLDLGYTPTAGTSGGDTIGGGSGGDVIYGQGGVDTIHGDDGEDYVEGGQDGDTLYGDAGQDDIVGGSLYADSGTGQGTAGQLDGGDNISGGAGADVILGDNGAVTRVGTLSALTQGRFDADGSSTPMVERSITPYDLGGHPTAGISGADFVTGDGGIRRDPRPGRRPTASSAALTATTPRAVPAWTGSRATPATTTSSAAAPRSSTAPAAPRPRVSRTGGT